jgi:hypothetical protein
MEAILRPIRLAVLVAPGPARRLAPGPVDAGAAAGGVRSADLLERRQLPGVSRRKRAGCVLGDGRP